MNFVKLSNDHYVNLNFVQMVEYNKIWFNDGSYTIINE